MSKERAEDSSDSDLTGEVTTGGAGARAGEGEGEGGTVVGVGNAEGAIPIASIASFVPVIVRIASRSRSPSLMSSADRAARSASRSVSEAREVELVERGREGGAVEGAETEAGTEGI